VTTVEVMAPLAQAAALVNALLPHLAPADRLRVQAALAGGVAGLMQRMSPLCFEACAGDSEQAAGPAGASTRCLTLSLAADDALVAYAAADVEPDHPPDASALEPGRVHVGCWWCGLKLGAQHVQFSATAATSAMADLLDTSVQVRGAFLQVAQAVPGGALAHVDEWNEAALLWADTQATAAAKASIASGLPLPPLDAYCRHLLAHGRADSGRVYA
jgi:hypothetical protein